MCGIVGAFDLTGRREFSQDRLRAMCGAIEHRGPDDEQIHCEPGLAFGVRRLSIVDLDGGRQPMSNETGSIWVAFNGELFEFPELFRSLKGRGHRFSTRCDTEAWVHLYEDHREQVLQHVKGQFAVSIWDSRNRSLLLARDRMGICPLYYTEVDGWLLWASEIKSLLSSGLVCARPDPAAIDHLFCFLAAPANRSFFAGIHSLPPGHALRVREGTTQLTKYWDLDFPDAGDEDRTRSDDDLADELEEHLRTAIRRRLRGDVPVVSYLSGGVDSSLILAMASQESGRKIPSFTVSLQDAGKNELSEAAETARLLGSPLNEVPMRLRDLADVFPRVILAAEGPVVDTVCSCMIRMSQRVHDQGFKVALTGEGADEGMAGYFWFKWQRLQRLLGGRLGQPIHRLLRKGMLLRTGDGEWCRAPYRAMAGIRTVQQTTAEMCTTSRATFYTAEMWSQLADYNPFDDLNLTNDRISRWDPLNQVSYMAHRSLLAGLLLIAKGDRSAMHSSVETRPPFLDEDVVDFCRKLPPEMKLRRLKEKWLLRRVAERYLPRHIAWRPKHMFNAGSFSDTVLQDDRPGWVDQLLSDESLRATGLFDPRSVHRQRRIITNRKRRIIPRVSETLGLTVIVATQLWHHLYCGGGLADLPVWSPPKESELRPRNLTVDA